MGRIDFYRTDNPLTPDPNDYKAVATNVQSVNKEAFVKRMMTEAEALRAFSVVKKVFIDVHPEGNTVNLGYMRTSINLTGVLDKQSMPDIDVTAVLGKEVKDAVKSNSMCEVHYNNIPLILDVKDDTTDTHDSVLTKGGVAIINGRNTKVDGADPDNGVYYTNTGQRYKSPKIVKNGNSELIAKIPDNLPDGKYKKVLPHFVWVYYL